MTYQFDRQLAQGAEGEAFLDEYFMAWFDIRRATPAEQRQGIDRWFTRGTRRLAIEYKTDMTAARTGNAFVETTSVDTAGKPGWALSSQAHMLVYYIPPDGLIYAIWMARLRRSLPRWDLLYPTRAIPNQGYHTHGLLVPLHEFEQIAETVISI